MGSVPLHPALVHLPLALAFLLPLFAIVAGIRAWRPQPGGRPWLVVPALALLLFGTGLAAMSAGEDDERVVEDVVSESVIEEHEQWAERFIWTAGATLFIALLGISPSPTVRRGAIVLTAAASIATAGLALQTGKLGGELVYEHGAAEAHRPRPERARPPAPTHEEHEEHDD